MHCSREYVDQNYDICGSYLILVLKLDSFFLLQESPEEVGWHDLVTKGFIEYIDTEEEETTMISMTINVSKWLNFERAVCSG